MKVETRLLLFLGVFFGILGVVYWTLTYYSPLGAEAGGVVMLGGTCTLGLLPGLYYLFWYRRSKGFNFFFWKPSGRAVGPPASDRDDATLEEGSGEIATFPGSSIWPLVLGSGAFLAVNGLVFGWWLLYPGAILIVTALVGVTAESRRGGHV